MGRRGLRDHDRVLVGGGRRLEGGQAIGLQALTQLGDRGRGIGGCLAGTTLDVLEDSRGVVGKDVDRADSSSGKTTSREPEASCRVTT